MKIVISIGKVKSPKNLLKSRSLRNGKGCISLKDSFHFLQIYWALSAKNQEFIKPKLIIIGLGKGSKIKLIIFAEFSANGGGGYPPSVKIINFLRCS